MDKEKLKKKIAILNEIEEREIAYPPKPSSEGDADWDIQNSNITDLPHQEFLLFLQKMEKSGVLTLTGGEIEQERDDKNSRLFNEEGRMDSELSIYFYKDVNLKKLRECRAELVELFSLKTANENLTKTQTEVVFLHNRQLCLNADRKKCYSPQPTTNRAKYLIAIINADGEQISAKKLLKEFNVKTINPATLISSEISTMNKIISKRLGTDTEFILGKEGYRLNKESYEIVGA